MSAPSQCPFLNKQLHVEGCPAFKYGCPFKNHTCPYKDMTHEEALAMMKKCPHLDQYLSECPKYNPDKKEGCPFDHEGKMDISKCPHFKTHIAEHEFENKFGKTCPFLDKGGHVAGCPAFEHGCPFKDHTCPFKDMTHDEAIEMMNKCPHLKEYLSKCPKYRPDQKEGCPFEHEGKMDISKCPHFAHHFKEHGVLPELHFPAHEAKHESVDELKSEVKKPWGHPEGGDESKCPFLRMKKAMLG